MIFPSKRSLLNISIIMIIVTSVKIIMMSMMLLFISFSVIQICLIFDTIETTNA